MSEHSYQSFLWAGVMLACCALPLTGCRTTDFNSPFGVAEDPPYLSPELRGYRGTTPNFGSPPSTGATIQSDKPVLSEPDLGTADIADADAEVIDEISPEPDLLTTTPDEPTDIDSGPRLRAPSLPEAGDRISPPPSSSQLLLEIQKPERVGLGGDVQYKITIRNDGTEPAEDVQVVCSFDRGLTFPSIPEQRLERSIGRVEAGETQTMTLVLFAEQQGRLCARFTLKSAGKEAAWKSVCTDVTQPNLSVQIIGPERRTVGSRAEYTIKIANSGDRPLRGVQTVLQYDDTLVPESATEGSVEDQDKNRLSWKLGDLPPGEGLQLQVELICEREAAAAAVKVDAFSADGERQRRQSKLAVTPLRGVLDLRIRDKDDLVRRDQMVNYEVDVHNRGFQDVAGVQVMLTPPKQIAVKEVTVTIDDQTLTLNHKMQDGKLVFEALDRLPADGRLRFSIRGQAVRTGDAKFQATVKSKLEIDAHSAEEWTTINQ